MRHILECASDASAGQLDIYRVFIRFIRVAVAVSRQLFYDGDR